jgi:hypothetical protein
MQDGGRQRNATVLRQLLRQPATLVLVAVNLVPLIGVVAWGWDAFVLLMLYWMETAIIAFWSMVRIAILPREAVGDLTFGTEKRALSRPALVALFTVHTGGFMAVHLLFLWVMFAGEWSRKIHSVRDFYEQMVVATGLWVPLLLLFFGHGIVTLFVSVKPALSQWTGLAPRKLARAAPTEPQGEAILIALYFRIFIMQLTIIVGVWFALVIGSVAPFIILIIIKTAFDVSYQLIAAHVREAFKRAKADSAASG